MKYRIISNGNKFKVQYKDGWPSGWSTVVEHTGFGPSVQHVTFDTMAGAEKMVKKMQTPVREWEEVKVF